MPFDGLETPFSYLAKFAQVIDLIEAPGQWAKHSYRNPGGQYCLKEALNVAGIAEIFEPLILREAVEVTGREFCCLESFNDWPDTMHGDVVFVLQRVRDNIVAGQVTLPAPAVTTTRFGWDGRRDATAGSWVSMLWRKLLA